MKRKRKGLVCCAWLSYGVKTKEETTSSMRVTSQGDPATEITHFERMGLNGLCSNYLILTRG